MIEVRGVTKAHLGQVVLDGVDLHVTAGRQVGLLGPGGAGKSLLLKIICGLVSPDSGEVRVDGESVLGLDPVALARVRFKIGMLFQNYALFDFMTVEENIAFPLRQEGVLSEEEIRLRVDTLLREIDLPRAHALYPNELSGGMKKRVTFARAVIRRPPIVFYDDPTAGLDPVISSKIFRLLMRTKDAGGTTAIVVSHDITGVREVCDEFVIMNHGRVVFQGTREEVERSEDRFVQQFWRGESDE